MANAEGQKVYLDRVNLSPRETVDSVSVGKGGAFRLKAVPTGEPTFYEVRLADGRSFPVLVDSCETVVLKADAKASPLAKGVSYERSPRNEKLQKVVLGASEIMTSINAHQSSKTPVGASLVDSIRGYKEMVRGLIYSDPASMVGYYAMFQTVNGLRVFDINAKEDHQLFSTVATSLNLVYPESPQVKYICNYVMAARKEMKFQAIRDSLVNAATVVNSPDIELPDHEGNLVKLSSLRGKTVLLFFWASGDKSSREANRQLAKLYRQYKSRGLEIYAVSFDTSKVLWESASEADGVEWTNVCDLTGNSTGGAYLYNVTSVPTNFILDPEGRIIGKDLYGTRLDNKMKELFGK